MMKLLKPVYTIVQKAITFFGFRLSIGTIDRKRTGYEKIFPTATYAPWQTDSRFHECFEAIKHHTKIDIYRCYDLWQMVGEVSELKGAFLEVGVWRGGSGALIAQKVKIEGVRDTVYLCDTFTGVIGAGTMDNTYKGGEHADTSSETVKGLLNTMHLDNVSILAGTFPQETGLLIPDTAFRFCHIDVDVYQSAKEVFEWVWPRLVPGGIVVFDDYGYRQCKGITTLVNEERKKTDRVTIYNVNGHAIIIKVR